jgi:putative hydrolases of HD superfamily
MQLIDPEDPRPPYVKIAASMRAAILAGELKAEDRIPIGEDLAEFFGVARATISSAIRILRDEGFLTSRSGGGVYVSGQASMPVPSGVEHDLAGLGTFLHEVGHLKNLPRSGWQLLGIPKPESVAEHSFRVGVIGLAIAMMEGADAGRVAALCLMHDVHETRIGDVPSVGRAYVTTAVPEAVSAHQTAALPESLGAGFRALTAEYEACETLAARVAKDADKLETLLQAREYAAQGYAAKPWEESSIQALRTESAKQLAQAITSIDSQSWWMNFAASYHELRATSRAQQGLKP